MYILVRWVKAIYIYPTHYILELSIGINNNMLEGAKEDRILHKVTSNMYAPVAK